MKIEMSKSRKQLCEADIDEAEDLLDTAFPADYREFLLEYNGGRPKYDNFPIENNPSDTHGMINFFFYLKDEGAYNLLKWANRMRGRVPSELIPIAIDPGGNLICLAVAGNNQGKVYFWDHEEEAEEGKTPTYDNVYAIADSFNQFLTNLTGPA
jgi:cell wall assembly regulator SMI1